MCDQLSSVGVEFDLDRASALFLATLRWSAAHPFPYVPSASRKHPTPWANGDLFPAALASATRDDDDKSSHHHASSPSTNTEDTDDVETLWTTARPWALGQTRAPTSLLQRALGSSVRRPGTFTRVDADTNEATREPLRATGEAVHSSVRVRLACGGLGLDDAAAWACEALAGDPGWRLGRGGGEVLPLGGDASTAPRSVGERMLDGGFGAPREYPVLATDGSWQWTRLQPVAGEAAGDETTPQTKVLPEEPLTGPCERLLLALTAGQHDVWRYAENKNDL